MQKICMLEGKHHRYPKGISKKIKINQLTERQKLVIFMNDIALNNVISFVDICEWFFPKYD